MLREQARRALGVALAVAERSVEHLIPPNAGLGRNLQVSGMPSYPVGHLCPPPFTAPVAVVLDRVLGCQFDLALVQQYLDLFSRELRCPCRITQGVEVCLQWLRHRRLNPGTQISSAVLVHAPDEHWGTWAHSLCGC